MLSFRRSRLRGSRGFSLIELAIGLVIVAVLLSSLLVPLVTQVDQRRTAETQRLLEDARDALVGFVAANGRFPCPATAGSNGVESPGGGGACTNWVGFLPAATLGLTPVDPQGFQTDAFGNQTNRIRYAVSDVNIGTTIDTFTTTSTTTTGMRGATMPAIAASNGMLIVCSTASGNGTSCTAGVPLANGTAIAVVYSVGKNATDTVRTPTADEQENLDADRVFVSRPPSDTPGAEYDDMLIWISPSMLFGRLIAAGQQP